MLVGLLKKEKVQKEKLKKVKQQKLIVFTRLGNEKRYKNYLLNI
jgi:hypothetical protein